MIPGKKYDPGTRTSRRPTPEMFTHLRKWVDAVEQNVMMTNITEITNIDQQLEQVSRFYISSIIQRVIAQLTAQYNDGFRTLKCTEDGALNVNIDKIAADTLVLATGTNVIGAVKFAGPTQIPFYADIDFAGGGDSTIKAGVAGKQIRITSLTLTVAGETNIVLKDGAVAISGAMDFGGADEPRGMVSNHGNIPLELTTANAFVIDSSAAVQVSGFVTGYIE